MVVGREGGTGTAGGSAMASERMVPAPPLVAIGRSGAMPRDASNPSGTGAEAAVLTIAGAAVSTIRCNRSRPMFSIHEAASKTATNAAAAVANAPRRRSPRCEPVRFSAAASCKASAASSGRVWSSSSSSLRAARASAHWLDRIAVRAAWSRPSIRRSRARCSNRAYPSIETKGCWPLRLRLDAPSSNAGTPRGSAR